MIKPDLFLGRFGVDLRYIDDSREINTYNKRLSKYLAIHYKYTLNNTILLYAKGIVFKDR